MALSAQVRTNTAELARAAQELHVAGKNNYAHALVLAKQKGWPLTISGHDNQVARLVGVDAFGFPKYYVDYNNTTAAATTGASQLWPGGSTGLGLSGSSANMKNKLGEWDGGSPLTAHQELVGRVTVKDGATPVDHSTHVAGTMIATGINSVAKGMAFGAQGMVSYEYNNDIAEMFGEAGNLLLSNHSYGILAGWNYNNTQAHWEWYGSAGATEDYKFGYYSDDAQALDSLAYNAPYYLVVKAAGNNRNENGPAVGQPYWGYTSASPNTLVSIAARPANISSNNSYGIISWDANAKNILTVGAVYGLPSGYTTASGITMSSFSSWGPTDDGRIKPDIVADGVNVTSCTAGSNTAYGTMSGTSMATPNVTGSLFLLQEYYSQLKSGNFMRSATLKGLAIHTADEAGNTPGPDYQFGWGLLDVVKAAAVITAAVPSNNGSASAHLLYENVLSNGGTYSLPVIAAGGGTPLVVTICWTDVKGNVDFINTLNNPAKKLVNDLDVRINDGTTTYMPWVLDPANPSNPATTGDNITDNVERINIDNPVAGQAYLITVKHKGTLARGQQAYSLIVSGVGGTASCITAPTITQVSDSLVSTAALFYQWYLNDNIITGATGKSYKPTQVGNYKVVTSNGLGCLLTSNTINVTTTATVDVNGSAIGLMVSPNPSDGRFNLSFAVSTRDNLKIEVVNMLGQSVYTRTYPGFTGSFSDQLDMGSPAAGIYILKIQHHNTIYLRKLLVK